MDSAHLASLCMMANHIWADLFLALLYTACTTVILYTSTLKHQHVNKIYLIYSKCQNMVICSCCNCAICTNLYLVPVTLCTSVQKTAASVPQFA